MRLAGFLLMMPAYQMNRDNLSKSGLKIITLGESTTADYFAPEDNFSWPRKLQVRLEKQGIKAQIINLAKGGTTTALIATDFKRQLEEIKPDIVISMMGINDYGHTRFRGETNIWTVLWNQIRVVKLVRLLKEQYLRRWHYLPLLKEIPYYHTNAPLEQLYSQVADSQSLQSIEGVIEDQGSAPCGEALLLLDLVQFPTGRVEPPQSPTQPVQKQVQLPDQLSQQTKLEFIKQATKLCPNSSMIQFAAMGEINLLDDKQACLQIAPQIAKYGLNLDDQVIVTLSDCYVNTEKVPADLLSLFEARGIELGSPEKKDAKKNGTKKVTEHHYRYIYEALKEVQIPWVVMQYPTLPLAPRQEIWSQEDLSQLPMYFVSNQDNFEKALAEKKFEEIFVDRFAGEWGHTTDFGHQLIADQVFPTVRKVIEEHYGPSEASH